MIRNKTNTIPFMNRIKGLLTSLIKRNLTSLIRILVFLLTFYILVFGSGVFNDFRRNSGWGNVRMNACLSNCKNFGYLYFTFTPPNVSNYYDESGMRFKLELKRVEFTLFDETSTPERVCIDKIFVGYKNFFGENIIQTPLCDNLGVSGKVNFDFTESNNFPSFVQYINAAFSPDFKKNNYFDSLYYPFVEFNTETVLQFVYHFETNGSADKEQMLYPAIYIEFADSKTWNVNIVDKEQLITKSDLVDSPSSSSIVEGFTTFLYINVSAPSSYKVTTMLLIAGLLVLVFLTFLIQDTTTFVQSIAALLFGMYGLRQVLLPQTILNVSTVVDIAYMILYMIIIYSIFDHVVVKLFTSKKIAKDKSIILISSSSSLLFHNSDCNYANRISKRTAVYFKNEAEAVGNNKKPCPYCLPPQPNNKA